MSKAETIKNIICNTIIKNDGSADWAAIKGAVEKKYAIKDWVKEVRNPMQALIAYDVIKRTDSVLDETYILTETTKSILADMAA